MIAGFSSTSSGRSLTLVFEYEKQAKEPPRSIMAMAPHGLEWVL